MMKKNYLLTLMMVLLGLFAGGGNAWADYDSNKYNAQMTAKVSTGGNLGTGRIYVSDIEESASIVNDEGYDGWFESPFVFTNHVDAYISGESQMLVPFYAYAKADEGSYFAGWSYVEGGVDLGNTQGVRLAVEPSPTRGGTKEYAVYATFESVRITGYSVSNSINVPKQEGASGKATVVFDVKGEEIDINDFVKPEVIIVASGMENNYYGEGQFPDENWRYESGKIIVDLDLTVNAQMAAYFPAGVYKSKVILASKSGKSTVVAPFYIRFGNVSSNEASVTIGEETTEYSTLADAVTAANAASDNATLTLLKDIAVSSTYTLSKSMSIDLNGYRLSSEESNTPVLDINGTGKTVTIVHNNAGGEIAVNALAARAISVTSGKLVLDGGAVSASGAATNEETAVIAISVASGAELEVNNLAMISASTPYAYVFAIRNEGTTTINSGTITAHADYSMAVGVHTLNNGSLEVNGGSISTSVDELHDPDPSFTDQDSWANSYAVFLGSLTGSMGSSSAVINGGYFNAISTSDKCMGICALASNEYAGSLTVNDGAVISAHSPRNGEPAFSIGMMMGSLTVNGGKFNSTAVSSGVIAPSVAMLYTNHCSATINGGYFKVSPIYYYYDTDVRNVTPTEFDNVHPTNAAFKAYKEGYKYYIGATAPIDGVCRIGTTSYAKLEDALAYANNNPDKDVLIIMQKDYTLPAGYYTLPSKATLLVPKSESQEKVEELLEVVPFSSAEWIVPSVNYTLTLADGVNIDVHGQIEVGGTQYSTDDAYTAIPYGTYGQIVMSSGSHMTLQNGAELRAWGYITGKGEIDARRGATVREQFQMADWKGANFSVNLIANTILGGQKQEPWEWMFPVSQYFIQNIESPVKYHPGAVLSTVASVSLTKIKYHSISADVSLTASAPDVKIVGVTGQDQAIFLMDAMDDQENTWVRKWYDIEHDQQVYEMNSGAKIGSMVINLGDLMGFPLRMDSKQFVLPITNNMKIHLLSGMMDFTQNTELLPGSEVEVDKKSTVSVLKKPGDAFTGSLYLVDADQWGRFACGDYAKHVKYRPGVTPDNSVRPIEDGEGNCLLSDAKIFVHGTFDTQGGYVFTTDGGAEITSTNEDAGTFRFNTNAPTSEQREELYHVTGNGTLTDPNDISTYDYDFVHFTASSAKLKNSDGFVETEGVAQKGDAYCYMDNAWTNQRIDEDDDCFLTDNLGNFYAKPAEYIKVIATKVTYNEGTGDEYKVIEGNEDHTYSDAAGTGRLFILMEGCQWWEVEKENNLYHCIHPDNDTYYYWDENDEMWKEKRFTITWLNWDGSPVLDAEDQPIVYEVPYGTQAQFLSTNPTREPNNDYTYNFTSWSPELGKVTQDVTYTATFAEQPRQYTIIFTEEGGEEIERQLLTHNEIPVCQNVPTYPGHILQWSPEIAAVTGDATYKATWLDEPPTEYAITFYDYDGTTKLKPTDQTPYMVAVGDMPTPPAQVNGKPATSEFTYVFDHWTPALEKVSVTSAKSYIAVYREEAKTFPVNFYFEQQDAEHKIGATQFLEIGQTPVIPDDERLQLTEDESNVYQLVWTPQLQTVVGHNDDYTYEYVASYTSTPKQYSLTLKCTPSGAATITGARADYAYGATPTITVTPNPGYEFKSWSDNAAIGEAVDGTYSRTVEINGNMDLTVICKCLACEKSEIVWMNEAGDAELAKDSIPVGSATIYHGTTPAKAATDQYSYTFYGWTTRDNEGHIINTYKNGMTPKVPDVENPSEQTYTYYACFTPVVRQYNVALSSNIPNVCMLVGAGTYNYSESAANATVIVSGYDAVNYTFDGWYKEGVRVSTAESYSFAVQSDVDLVAKFTPVTYTVTWKSEDGVSTLETDADQAYGAATAFNSEEPTKDAHTFIGWTTAANGEGSFYAKGATPAVSNDAEYYAYFVENAQNLVIGVDGEETLDAPADYANFVITSDGEQSGQLINAQHLSVLGEAIYRLQKSFAAGQWYAVAVPWRVDPNTGIYGASGRLASGSQIYIIEFDGTAYANVGGTDDTNQYWHFLHETGADMVPGKLYMIYLRSAQSKLDFHKKAGAALQTRNLTVSTASGSAGASFANWNAISNPALYTADLSTGVTAYQTYDNNGDQTYTVVYAATSGIIVAKPIFVQVNTPSTVYATVSSSPDPAPAYRRAPQAANDAKFVVEISRNGKMADRLIVETADEKENRYVIGQDLAKFGVSSKVAQMWVNRYDAKLCVNTTAWDGERAEYPLSIFAPASGDYTITNTNASADYALYLTLNGEAIWNLSEGAYVLSLERGTATNYGLRVSARAPQNATGVDEAIIDAKGETATKVLIDNQVFIIRGDKVYTIDGQVVK